MRPFAGTPAAPHKGYFNGQNYSFYNLNWINVRRSQENGMLFFIQNVYAHCMFPSLSNKNILQ
jgi:hypothetical protein